MAVKKATKKKVVKKVIEPRTVLTDLEMSKMDLANERVKASDLELAVMQLKHKLFVMENEKQLLLKSQDNIRIKSDRKALNDIIKKELSISSELWGYNPETGEIQG